MPPDEMSPILEVLVLHPNDLSCQSEMALPLANTRKCYSCNGQQVTERWLNDYPLRGGQVANRSWLSAR